MKSFSEDQLIFQLFHSPLSVFDVHILRFPPDWSITIAIIYRCVCMTVSYLLSFILGWFLCPSSIGLPASFIHLSFQNGLFVRCLLVFRLGSYSFYYHFGKVKKEKILYITKIYFQSKIYVFTYKCLAIILQILFVCFHYMYLRHRESFGTYINSSFFY